MPGSYRYLSAKDPRIQAGLGNETSLDQIKVTWTDGTVYVTDTVQATPAIDIRYPGSGH